MNAPQSATHGLPSAALSFSGGRMDFVTHHSKEININGSHLQGYIDAGYAELVALFGKPHGSDGHKVDAEWNVEFSDGTVATIYNYKNGRNYIGGFTKQAVDKVQIAIDLHREQAEPKPETEAEAAFETAIEMMEMLRKTKGIQYADLVEAMMLTKKRCDLFCHLLAIMVETETMPEDVALTMSKLDAMLSSKIMSKMFKHSTIKGEQEHKEVMGWVDRLMSYEKMGAEAIIKEHQKGRDEE
jgi:hypothetical protein